MKYTFILDGLNCAHCASKIEEKITLDKRFNDVSFNFATKKLILNTNIENPKFEIQQIVDSIEDGVTVKSEWLPKAESTRKLNLPLYISIALFAVAFVLHLFDTAQVVTIVLSVISTLLSGYRIFKKGVKSIFSLNIDETTLLTVAVVSAFVLGEFVEACAVTVLFALGEMFEELAVSKSRRDISKLSKIKADTASIYDKNGNIVDVSAENVSTGSTIVIKPYSRVPLDCVITKGESYFDTSALTGESVPMYAKTKTELLSGMLNQEHMVEAVTTKALSDSTATRILKLIEESAQNKGNSEKFISRFAKVYTPIIIVLSLLIAVVPGIITGDFSTWIYRALVCLVSSCPCAIVISVPLAFFSAIGSASTHGVLIKGSKYVEALSKANCCAFDKTGTLTTGKMSVTKIEALSDYSEDEILSIAASAESLSQHPIAKAIKAEAQKRNLALLELKDFNEKAGFGVTACDSKNTYSCGNFSKDTGDICVYINDKLIGTITVTDTVRKEALAVLRKLRKLSISKLVMLTGDSKAVAEKTAESLGIDHCYSKLLPQDKLHIMKELQNKKNICMYIGDGINDAPTMALADVSVAMGLSSDAAIEAADVVLCSDSLSPITDAVTISRKAISTVKANIVFALAVKTVVIVLGALGFAPMWLAVIADTGVSVLCVLNSVKLLHK